MAEDDTKELPGADTSEHEDAENSEGGRARRQKIERVAPQTSDHEKAKSRGRLYILLIFIGILVCGWIVYSMFNRLTAPVRIIHRLPPSQSTWAPPPAPPPVKKVQMAHLRIDPPAAIFGDLVANKDHETTSLAITAIDGPVHINEITLPFADNSGIDMRADSCINKDLPEGAQCSIVLRYAPLHSDLLGNEILIKGIAYEAGGTTSGKSEVLSSIIEVHGRATEPPPPPPAPIIVPREDHSQELANAYLARREHPNLASQDNGIYWRGAAAPENADWTGLGFGKAVSSYPVDMSRVVTMDKAIPAVIKVPIDTREPARAVATVERDIYGGDGREVLIERGSTLIGMVGSIGDTSEEKVGISWVRLIRPDGVAFAFEATSGDAMGRSGVLGHIDNRWFERFGKAALLSFVQGGITIALNPNNNSTINGSTTTVTQNAASVANNEIMTSLTPLYQEYMREQLDLPPIRTVPVGTRITVWPTSDLWIRPLGRDEVLDPTITPQAQVQPRPLTLPANYGQQIAPQVAGHPATQQGLAPSYTAVYPDAQPGAAPPPEGNVNDQGAPAVNTTLSTQNAAQISTQNVTHNQTQTSVGAAYSNGYTNGYATTMPTTSTTITPSGAAVAIPPWAAQTR